MNTPAAWFLVTVMFAHSDHHFTRAIVTNVFDTKEQCEKENTLLSGTNGAEDFVWECAQGSLDINSPWEKPHAKP